VPRATAELHAGISELHCEFDELATATQHLQTSTALGMRAAPLTEHRHRWFVAMARVRDAEGEPDGAIELLDQAEHQYLRGFFPEVRPIAALKARVRIRHGRLAEGVEWARSCGLSAAGDLSYLREFEHITLARLLIAQYRLRPAGSILGDALGLLHRLLQAAEASGRHGSTYEILVLQALALEAQGNRSLALVPLERALLEAGPEGYVRLFLDEGAPMAALLHGAGQQGIAPALTGRLLRAFGTIRGESIIRDPLSESISQRELQVLRLLNTPLSGPEIARELFVSVNTLRTHTKHIFAKLDVNSRRAAVHEAKGRGLI
jgi:LuxR family maltose regulon positive regulatory protein